MLESEHTSHPPKPISVLLVDDDPSFQSLIRAFLSRGRALFTVEYTSTFDEALEAINSGRHQICLIDYELDTGTGAELIRLARAHGVSIPMIVLTSHTDVAIDIEAMNAGAVDYLIKGRFDANLLERSIRYALDRKRSEDALRRSERELQAERDFTSLVVDTVASLIIVIDVAGHVVRFNRECERVSGYSYTEVMGRPFPMHLLPPEERNQMENILREISSGSFQTTYRSYWISRSGERRLVSWTNTAILAGDGSVAYLIGTGQDITEHHAVETALRQSQDLFRSFMNHTPVISYIKDRDGRYLLASEQLAFTIDRQPEDVIGKTDFDFYPEDVSTRLREADEQIFATSSPASFIEKTIERDGEHYWFTIKFPITGASGDLFLGGSAIDITEQVHFEETLRKSEERFQLAARATKDVFWDWNLLEDTLWWNQNLYPAFHYLPHEVGPTIEWWNQNLHPDDRQRVTTSLFATIERKEQFWTQEYRFRRGDASYAYVRDRGYVIYDNSLNAIRMIGAIEDFTDRRAAEEALRESEKNYRRIVETAQEGIWRVDAGGVTTYVNARMAEMIGYRIDECIGRPQAEFMDERGQELYREMRDRRRQGGAERFDFKFIRKDGSPLWTIVSANPEFDSDGGFDGSLQMIADITDRKLAEDALQEAFDKLEARVQERTSEIVEMMAQLERAHLNQKRFIADASHDLRSPLTVVRAELDLLLGQAGHDPQLRRSLQRALNEAKRLNTLANDLLLLATLDAGESLSEWNTIRLDELLLECIANLTSLAREKDMSWDIQLEDPVEIVCDTPSLERALTNLLENALKYSPGGNVIQVSLFLADAEAMVIITDSGPGIPSEDIPRVFDRFYRSDQARSTVGTGLGLSIVKAIIDKHNGTVTIDSQYGSGTTVTVALPV